MQFTQIPQQYAPLGGELRYAVSREAAGNIDIRITGAADGALLGAKRFAAVAEASFDAAPYLRRQLRFVPVMGGTGFYPAEGRTVTAVVEAAGADGGAAVATTPARTFLPGAETPEGPRLRTSMPLTRLIPEGAGDELTLLTDGACTVTVTAEAGDTTTAESYRTADAGLHLFRLDTRDFQGAERITVDAGVCGTVVYSVTLALQETVRLAWRSNAGSVEHYTFPVVRTTTVRAGRQEAEGREGRVVVASDMEREMLLASAYESQAVLEALAELTTAPEVWIAGEDGYTSVSVATDEAVVRRHGTLCCLEIAVRPNRKIRMSWN